MGALLGRQHDDPSECSQVEGETWRSSRKPSAIQDSATESAKRAIEGSSPKAHIDRVSKS